MKQLYKDFRRMVTDRWNDGEINELEEEGSIVIDHKTKDGYTYRVLTEEEYDNWEFNKII